MKPNYIYTEKKTETAILVAVGIKSAQEKRTTEYLDELEALATTAGALVIKRFVQNLDYPNPRTFIGEGKLEEIQTYTKLHATDMIIFDDELSPSQIKNLEQTFKEIKIIDRSTLILDIFARNAKTAQAKTQVELAQCQYLLPRLTRMWTHLSKQKGGIGMKGPGETEIETDRRAIRNKIDKLKERLQQIEKQRKVQRQNRTDKKRIALVGYTNVGKSTIMNILSDADVLAENKLFATLDATVRKVVLEDTNNPGRFVPFILSDTVGFIRKLPHLLVESFKSTLDEVLESDVLIHVVDISHPEYIHQMDVVKSTLEEIGAKEKPVLYVFNKTDKYLELNPPTEENPLPLQALEKSWMAKENMPVVLLSAVQKHNLEGLKDAIFKLL